MLHQRRRADGRGFFRRPDWTARRSPPLSGLVLTTWEGLFLERAVSDRPDVLLRNATLSVVVGRRQSDPYGGLRGRSLSTLGIWVCVCVCSFRPRKRPRAEPPHHRRIRSNSEESGRRRANRHSTREVADILSGVLRRDLSGKHSFRRFPSAEFRPTARTFVDVGYFAADTVRGMDGRERLTHAKNEKRSRGRH